MGEKQIPQEAAHPRYWQFEFICKNGQGNKARGLLEDIEGRKVRLLKGVQEVRMMKADGFDPVEKLSGACKFDAKDEIIKTLAQAEMWGDAIFKFPPIARGVVRIEDTLRVRITPELKQRILS